MEIYVIGTQWIYNEHFSLMINYCKNKSSFDLYLSAAFYSELLLIFMRANSLFIVTCLSVWWIVVMQHSA